MTIAVAASPPEQGGDSGDDTIHNIDDGDVDFDDNDDDNSDSHHLRGHL